MKANPKPHKSGLQWAVDAKGRVDKTAVIDPVNGERIPLDKRGDLSRAPLQEPH